ncbi:MAG: ABC transporter substrate-binding protein, partial [Caldilineaceae bacterium]|nr:ABC transporter substrate-binding protein [Caldilineaceae bacterium]
CSRFSTPTVDAPSTTADGPSTATTAVDGETEHTPPRLRIAFANVPTQLDPAIMSANAAIQLGFAAYEGLVRIDHELAVQPALAERWEASDDLQTWTFTLRQDVLFHHGTPFTARDVIYTYERLLDPVVASPLRTVLSSITAVEEIEDGSVTGAVRFHLAAANADLPLLCGAPQAFILAHDYPLESLAKLPSGTGPFRVENAIPGQQFRLVRNEDYWAADQVAVQEVHHLYLPTFEQRAAAFNTGAIDLLADVSSAEAQILANNDAITIVESASGAYLTVVMQATERPFTDIRVRRALKLCLARKEIQTQLLAGRGEIAWDQPVASISPFHADLTVHPQDIAAARQLLADAGYPNGIELDLITADLDPGMVDLAYLVQAMAAPAGFTIRPTEVPADVYWSSYWAQVPFHIGSWNFRPSIDETFMVAFHSRSTWNESRWFHADLDTLLERARSEPDNEQRKALYQQAQKLVMEEGAVIIPCFRPVLTALHNRVSGYVPHPAGWINLRGVRVAESDA